MVKKTFEDVIEIVNLLNKIDINKDDKLSYAVKKISKSLTKKIETIQTELNEELNEVSEEIGINNASIDKDGNLVFDDVKVGDNIKRVYRFTPANKIKEQREIKKAQKEIVETFKKKHLEFKEHIVSSDDERLNQIFSEEDLEVLDGVIVHFVKSEAEVLHKVLD